MIYDFVKIYFHRDWFQYLLQFPNSFILSYCMHKEVLESSLKQNN